MAPIWLWTCASCSWKTACKHSWMGSSLLQSGWKPRILSHNNLPSLFGKVRDTSPLWKLPLQCEAGCRQGSDTPHSLGCSQNCCRTPLWQIWGGAKLSSCDSWHRLLSYLHQTHAAVSKIAAVQTYRVWSTWGVSQNGFNMAPIIFLSGKFAESCTSLLNM